MESIYPRLANLAIRIEGKGQYNIAKYVRATLDSLLRHNAFNQSYPTDTKSILADLDALIQDLGELGYDQGIVDRLRNGYQVMAKNAISKIPEFPTPVVCRRCGYIREQAQPENQEYCPTCAADPASFSIHRPIYWMREFDPIESLERLNQTPLTYRHRLARIPLSNHDTRLSPGEWSPLEVIKHIRDAENVLHSRIKRILAENNPYLDFQMVWDWADKPAVSESIGSIFESYSGSRAKTIDILQTTPLKDWWRTAIHEEFGPVTLIEQVSYFAAHEISHLRQLTH
jgi:predicted Zn-ribbon and HTH transcriptional regulator